MTTSKNPVSVSIPREGLARFYADTCSKAEAGALIMNKKYFFKKGDIINGNEFIKEFSKGKVRFGEFKCGECDTKFICPLAEFVRRDRKSCGCLKGKLISVSKIKHGSTGSRLYKKWSGIKRRCYNKNEVMYSVYGGTGIKMWDGWIHNSKAFMNYCKTLNGWDNSELTIDRIDPYKDYEPGNIRFASYTIQARNIRMRKNNTSGYCGVSKNKNKWLASIGINYKVITIGRYSTPLEAAIARDQYIIDNKLDGFNLQVL